MIHVFFSLAITSRAISCNIPSVYFTFHSRAAAPRLIIPRSRRAHVRSRDCVIGCRSYYTYIHMRDDDGEILMAHVLSAVRSNMYICCSAIAQRTLTPLSGPVNPRCIYMCAGYSERKNGWLNYGESVGIIRKCDFWRNFDLHFIFGSRGFYANWLFVYVSCKLCYWIFIDSLALDP